ncbi:DUF1259 domain-containing protein [Planococcus lenghuensis]|uniref:Uncharacterized protein n=1 Tax=Planococcus lenghuensis TaxID=2213202 RepID=A0A1Q2KZ33_9BACL|nr:DUF1259 domain-containing protein [Planococcus lenghuensis]AQQ53396.1 hypothetical protein B0X71_10140 [Planococcus lenghuensis]
MKPSEAAAQQVRHLLDMEIELGGEKYVFSKSRTIEIGTADLMRTCMFDLIVSFEQYQHSGLAQNEAELYLRAEECEEFLSMLIRHEYPLPTDYQQWQEEKADIVCMHLRATEPPEIFAARLADAFLLFDADGDLNHYQER